MNLVTSVLSIFKMDKHLTYEFVILLLYSSIIYNQRMYKQLVRIDEVLNFYKSCTTFLE